MNKNYFSEYTDKKLRKEFLANPKSFIQQKSSYVLPDDVEIVVKINTPKCIYFVLHNENINDSIKNIVNAGKGLAQTVGSVGSLGSAGTIGTSATTTVSTISSLGSAGTLASLNPSGSLDSSTLKHIGK